MDDGYWITKDQLGVSDEVPSRGFCFGVHVESMWAIGEQSELVTPSGEQFDLPMDRSWSPLGPHVGPMLAPCWAHVGGRWASKGILERSWSDLELILRPFLINIEQKMKGRGWILEKSTKAMCFCLFFEVPEVPR